MLPRREVTGKSLKKPLHPCRFHPVRHISVFQNPVLAFVISIPSFIVSILKTTVLQ